MMTQAPCTYRHDKEHHKWVEVEMNGLKQEFPTWGTYGVLSGGGGHEGISK